MFELTAFLMTLVSASSANWTIDPAHTSAMFSVRHLMVSNVRGVLGKVTGTIHLDDKDISHSWVDASIDARGVDTREPARDQHLRSPDFLDVGRFPEIHFKSTKVERAGGGKFKVTGDLTIHGVTRSIVLDVNLSPAQVTDPWGHLRRGASATTKLSRQDFGLRWGPALEGSGGVVGNEIGVVIDVEMIRDPQ